MLPRVVLVNPEIPPNTGNVARTCAAVGCALHLVEPLGFEISDRQLRRAGLDYWPWVDLHRHADLASFLAVREQLGGRLVALTAHGSSPVWEEPLQPSDWLLFGRERDGLPAELLQQADRRLTIPMPRSRASGRGGVRSLNLSVAVGVAVFEAVRQLAAHPESEWDQSEETL